MSGRLWISAGQTAGRVPGQAAGKWYFKVTVGHDPLTGKRDQITRRGFADHGRGGPGTPRGPGQGRPGPARSVFRPVSRSTSSSTSTSTASTPIRTWRSRPVSTTGSTRMDYIRPYIGDRRVHDVTPEVILAWQRKLLKEGGTKRTKGKDRQPRPRKAVVRLTR